MAAGRPNRQGRSLVSIVKTLVRPPKIIDPFAKKRTTNVDVDFARQVNSITSQLTEQQRRRRGILVPGHSMLLPWIDILVFVALMYTATFTPYEVAFLSGIERGGASNPRFIMNRVVDCIFLTDMVLQFCIAYEKPPHHHDGDLDAEADEHHEIYEFSRGKIALKYARSWLVFDVATIGVSVFDILPVVTDMTSGMGFDPGPAVILRVVRILRLIKLLRLVRAERTFSRWEAQITLTYGQRTMLRCLAMLIISAHWYACVFALQATMHSSPRLTWMGEDMYSVCPRSEGEYDELVASGEIDPLAVGGSDRDAFNSKCGDLGVGTWYLASFTWATMVITGTGGTDFYPSHRSHVETAMVCLLVIVGAALWTQVLALFCDVATNSHPGEVGFRQTLDDLNSFIDVNHLEPKLGERLREYLHQQKHVQLRQSVNSVVLTLSPSLQVETIMSLHRPWLSKVWFMRKLEAPCLVQVAMAMQELVFAPGEAAPRRHLYVVKWGIVLHGGHVLTSGKQWGEDMILAEQRYAKPYIARMMTYVGAIALSRTKLLAICANFPASMRELRKSAAFLAVRRHLINAAREIKDEAARAQGALQPDKPRDLLTQITHAALQLNEKSDRTTPQRANGAMEEASSLAPATSSGSNTEPPFFGNLNDAVLQAPPIFSPEHKVPKSGGRWKAETVVMMSALPDDAPMAPAPPEAVQTGHVSIVQPALTSCPSSPEMGTSLSTHLHATSMGRVESRIDALDDRVSEVASICARLAATVESIDNRLAAQNDRPPQNGRPLGVPQRGAPPARLAARDGWAAVDRRPPSLATSRGPSPSVRL